jgi:hypothetical protein
MRPLDDRHRLHNGSRLRDDGRWGVPQEDLGGRRRPRPPAGASPAPGRVARAAQLEKAKGAAPFEKAKGAAPFRSMFFKPAKRSATDDDDELGA